MLTGPSPLSQAPASGPGPRPAAPCGLSRPHEVPRGHKGIILAASGVMVLARLDDGDVPRLDRVIDAVDRYRPLPLQEDEDLIHVMDVHRFGVALAF